MNPKFFAKLLITGMLLFLVFRFVDGERFWETLVSIPAWCALLTIGGYVVGQVISAYKWWLIARSGGVSASFRRALKSYFVGMFVNFFGLGIVGGDVARGALLGQGEQSRTTSFASVIADRLHGLAILALIGTLATALFGLEALSTKDGSVDTYFVYLLYAMGGGIVLGWFLGPSLLLRIVPPGNKLRAKAEMITSVFPKKLSVIAGISFVSVLFHLLQITLHWIMAQGFGVNLPILLLLVTIPFVNILSSLPISWNGLGVRENAYVFFLSPLYLSQEQAVAMGAVWLVAVTASSVLGGIIAFLSGDFAILKNISRSPSNADKSTSQSPASSLQDSKKEALRASVS